MRDTAAPNNFAAFTHFHEANKKARRFQPAGTAVMNCTQPQETLQPSNLVA